MKKWQKISLGVIGGIILLIIIDLGCVFIIKHPIFAIKKNNGTVYKGLFYDIYACEEYSLPQIKVKGTKYTCIDLNNKENKIKKIIDATKENFNCDEALEKFFEDENYIYSWSCIKNEYMIVKYEDGREETVESALKNKNITNQRFR